jgi:multicomponent K+:H+ antiporter subunit G
MSGVVRELLVTAGIMVGAAFTLVGAIGLVRLPDVFSRLHGPTKATTLGVGGLLAASSLYFSTRGDGVSLHELLVAGFLFATAPVSAHLVARVAMREREEGQEVPPPPAAPERAAAAEDSAAAEGAAAADEVGP